MTVGKLWICHSATESAGKYCQETEMAFVVLVMVLLIIWLSLQATHISSFYRVCPAWFRKPICARHLDITYSFLFFIFIFSFFLMFLCFFISEGMCLLLVDEVKKLFFSWALEIILHYFNLETPINQSFSNNFPLRRFEWTCLPMYAYFKLWNMCVMFQWVYSVLLAFFSKNFSFLCIVWLYIKEYVFVSIGAFILCANPFLMISCFSLSFELPILGVAKATIRIKWHGIIISPWSTVSGP